MHSLAPFAALIVPLRPILSINIISKCKSHVLPLDICPYIKREPFDLTKRAPLTLPTSESAQYVYDAYQTRLPTSPPFLHSLFPDTEVCFPETSFLDSRRCSEMQDPATISTGGRDGAQLLR